jgi:hypothetical protein
LVCNDIWWVTIHHICCFFFQILHRCNLCGVCPVLYIHAEIRICEWLNPEMFEAMQWSHFFSIYFLLRILANNIWIIKPQYGSVLCCWYDLWSHSFVYGTVCSSSMSG